LKKSFAQVVKARKEGEAALALPQEIIPTTRSVLRLAPRRDMVTGL
jgi:hypothetical protein